MADIIGRGPDVRLSIAPGVHFRAIDDEIILLDAAAEHYYGLSGSGAVAWLSLTETGDLEAAVAAVCRDFDVEPATARADISELVQSLLEKRFLVTSG
ncbi:MAG TPA: PqqD family protein [Mycobacteriales bacterium]|nr:PqqD family protein [Mycobacteriales bacterium]